MGWRMATTKKRVPKLTLVPARFGDEDYVHLVRLFAAGAIWEASKSDLERYAVMLVRPGAHAHFGRSNLPQLCDTVRTLLLVRMSEDANVQAARIGSLAKWIAVAAILVMAFQALHTIWPILPKSSPAAVASNAPPVPSGSAAALQEK